MSVVDHSGRVALFHAAASRADELPESIDPAVMPATTCEWTTRLVTSLGCIACSTPGTDLEACIVEHGAWLLLWAEQIEADRRAA